MSRVTLYKFEPAWGLPSFSPECICLEAYLRLFNVKFSEEACTSENASPTGTLPAVDLDGLAVDGYDPEGGSGNGGGEDGGEGGQGRGTAGDVRSIIDRLKEAGMDLDKGLSSPDASELEAYAALVDAALAPATAWALWGDDDRYADHTRAFFGQIFPFPLSRVFPWKLRRDALAKLSGAQNVRSETQALETVTKAYASLAAKLKGKDYFFGRPTQLDALVYSHLVFHAKSPVGRLMLEKTLAKFPALGQYVNKISAKHFADGPALLRDPGTSRERERERKAIPLMMPPLTVCRLLEHSQAAQWPSLCPFLPHRISCIELAVSPLFGSPISRDPANRHTHHIWD